MGTNDKSTVANSNLVNGGRPMHRNEIVILKTVSLLLKAAYGKDYSFPKAPCTFLK